MQRKIRRFLAIDLSLLAVLVVVLAGLLLTHRVAIVTTHGDSMSPVYHQGDLVLVAKQSSYRIGQIAGYRLPGKDFVVLHRIIGGDRSGYAFKGDHNQSTDPTRSSADRLIGSAVLHIAHGGIWFSRATSPTAIGVFAFLLLAGGGTAARTRRKRRRDFMSRAAHRPRTTTLPSGTFSSAPPSVTVIAGAAAVVAVLAFAFGALAWTRPVQQAVRTQHAVEQTMAFSYRTTVPRSPAYDGTTVTSPDPVFRRLANAVDVHFDYRGKPGSVAVAARLETASGWHSTLPLTARTSFTGKRYTGVARLDLAAIERRAEQAAAVTGVPVSQVDIAVVPSVETTGQRAFAPALKLALTPLQLNLAGDLTAASTAQTTSLSRATATLSIAGAQVPVSKARSVTGLLLLGSLLVLGLLAFIGLFVRPESEGVAIRRHYSTLLVPVHPMPPPVGRPVVDVSDFATLVKVAHRYGLLVMHWARAGVETFVVQDDAITYRYRAGAGSSGDDAPGAGWADAAIEGASRTDTSAV